MASDIDKQFEIRFDDDPVAPPAPAPISVLSAPRPALSDIDKQFGISFETPTETPAVAPTAAGPAPGTEVASPAPGRLPSAIAPPPREYTGGGSGWEREPTTTERVVETFAPPKPTAEMGTVERLSRHFAGGVLGTAEGLGGALQWVTGGALGKDFSNYMADLRKQVTPEGEASFIDQLASGAGSMATFFIPGFGTARAASVLGRIAPKAAQWLGAGTMAVTEAATEAGQVFRNELEKGKDEGKASTAANWTFWLNLPVLTLTDKLAFFGNEGKALSRALRGMVTEGSQESLQEVISTWSQEEQQNLKNILTSGAVGALLGGGVGAIAKPMGVRQGESQPRVETAPPAVPVGGEFNRTGLDTLMGQQEIAPGPPVLPPGARPGIAPEPGTEGAPAVAVEPGPETRPPAPPEAEVPPEVAAAPPSPVIPPGFEVTKTRKGWSVLGMDFKDEAVARGFAAKAAAADTGVTPPVAVEPGPETRPPAPPEAEVPPEVAAAPPSPVIPPGFEVTKTRKGWSVLGMDFKDEAVARGFAAKAAAADTGVTPPVAEKPPVRPDSPMGVTQDNVAPEPKPEPSKAISEIKARTEAGIAELERRKEAIKAPDQPLDISGTATQAAATPAPADMIGGFRIKTSELPKSVFQQTLSEYIKNKKAVTDREIEIATKTHTKEVDFALSQGRITPEQARKLKEETEPPFKMPTAEALAGMSDADLEALADQAKTAGIDVEMLGTGAYAVNEPGPGDPFLERLKALRQEAMSKVPGAVVTPTGALSAEPVQAVPAPEPKPFNEYIQTGVPGARVAVKTQKELDDALWDAHPLNQKKEVKAGVRKIAGGIFKHFTSPESKVALESGQPFDVTRGPQHGTGSMDLGDKTGKMFGNRLYLSLDDAEWTRTRKYTGGGKNVELTLENREQYKDGDPYFDYKNQKWMVNIGGHQSVTLHPVDFTIDPGARVLTIDSIASYRAAMKEASVLAGKDVYYDNDETWDALAQKYDVVAIQNTKALAAGQETGHKFFKYAKADQLVVLNPDVAKTAAPEYLKTGVPGARVVAPPAVAPALPPDAWKFPRDEYIQEGLKGAEGLPAKAKAAFTRSLIAEHERSVEEQMQLQNPELGFEQIGDYPKLAAKYFPEPGGEPPAPVPVHEMPFSDFKEALLRGNLTENPDVVAAPYSPEYLAALDEFGKATDAAAQRFPGQKASDVLIMARQTSEQGSPELLALKRAEESLDKIKAKELDRWAQATYGLTMKNAPEPTPKPAEPVQPTPLPPFEAAAPKVLSPEMEAVAAFNQKYGGAARVGIPEAPPGVDLTGLATDIDPVTTGFLPATKSPTSLPTYKNFPTEKLELVPEIFQHKREADPLTGGGVALTDIKKYDQTAAGLISVFETKDGRFLVSNGHQRTNAAIRLNEPTVGIQVRREVDGWTVKSVRMASAIENLQGGTVDALDIGAYLRESGLSADDLIAKGVSLTKGEVQKGIGLSGLPDRIWIDVYRGVWGHHGDAQAVEKGAALGALRENPAAQEAIYKRLMELQSEGKDLSLPAIRNLVDAGRVAIVTAGQQQGLFGYEDVVNSLIFERAALVTYIQKELTTDKNAHLAANRERDRLEAAGNVIDAKANKAIAERAKEVLGVFSRSSKVGWTETSRVLNEFAERFAQAKDIGEENAIKQEALTAIHSALEADYQAIGRADLSQATGRGGLGKEPGQYGGERIPGAPQKVAEPTSTYERPLSKFEKRLNGIISQYPNADPERVAQALRAAPKSTDRELAGLAAMKPGEASGVVRGSLTAMQRAELAKRSGVPGAALFPEMGMGGGGGLFNQAPERSAPEPSRVPAGARPVVEKPVEAKPEVPVEGKPPEAPIDEFDHLRTAPEDETTGKVGDRTLKQETLFMTGEIPPKETENGKNAPNQAGVEGRPESDLSPDREATRRQFEDFRRGVDQELPGSQGRRVFSDAEYAEELGNSQEFDVIRQEAKAFGLSAIPVKNMGPSGAIVRDYGEQPLLIINADVKGITPTQVAGHEIFHDRRYKGHQSATNIVNAVDLNSNTTKSYSEWIRSIREQLGIESPSNREVMEEIAADYAAGIEKFEYNGVSYNIKDCFRDAEQIELYLERYKESPTTEASVNALYGYDKSKYSTPEERQGWVAPGEPKPERQPLPAGIGGRGPRPVSPERTFLARFMPGYSTFQNMKQGVQSLVLPSAESPEHLQAAEVLGSHLGPMNRATKVAATKLSDDSSKFTKLGVNNPDLPFADNPGPKFISDMMQGRVSPELQPIADRINGGNLDRLRRLAAVGAPIETVRENYFGLIWQKDSIRAFNQALREAIDEGRGMAAGEGGLGQVLDLNTWSAPDKAFVKARTEELLAAKQGSDTSALQYLARTPFKGPEGFRKAKVFDDVMTGGEFGLKLVSNNPIDIAKLKFAEMDRSIMANGAIQEWKASGDVKFNHVSKRIPEGWVEINDKYGKVYGPYDPAAGSKPLIGHYIAKKPVAGVLNNYLSSTIYNSPYFGEAFKKYMAAGNLLNQSQLGVGSAFHGGFTVLETQITAGAEVIKDLWGAMVGSRSAGQLWNTLKNYPTTTLKTPLRGGKILAEWANPTIEVSTSAPVSQLPTTDASGIAIVAKAAEIAGGGFSLEKGLRTNKIQAVKEAWYSGKTLKAALNSPLAFIELSSKHIQDFLVPRQKAGVFGELVGRILEQNPTKTLQELRPEFRAAWNRVDARLGQVQYDRLFANNAAKNVIQAIVRAPGWTGGTMAEVGGAFKDSAKFMSEWIKTGKLPKELPDRVAYTWSLMATIGIINGLLTYAFTGEPPEGVDYWAFRDGTTDPQGNPGRWILPAYTKDLFAYTTNPGHTLLAKTHPLISLIGDVVKNKTYYGEEITSSGDSFIQKQIDRGKFTLSYFTPFWISGAGKAAERGGGLGKTAKEAPEKLVAPLVGVMPAARAYTATEAQKVMDEYNNLMRPTMTTKQVQEEKRLKAQLRELAGNQDKTGFQEVAREATEKGTLTRQQIKTVVDASHAPSGLGRFVALPVEWMVKVWKLATPEEKEVWGQSFLKKISSASTEIKIRNRDALIPVLRDMGLDPYADALENLAISEKGSTFKLAGLGIRQPVGEMPDMDTVSTGLLKELAAQEAKLGTEKKARAKKNKYSFLGIQ